MLLYAGKGKSCSCCYPHSPGCGYCPLRYRTSLRNSAPSQSAHPTSPRSGSIGERGGRRLRIRDPPEQPSTPLATDITTKTGERQVEAPTRDRADLPGLRPCAALEACRSSGRRGRRYAGGAPHVIATKYLGTLCQKIRQ